MTGHIETILGTLGSADGKGVVRMQDRFATDIDDLWAALTDPERLARWIGTVEGDLRVGGAFQAHFVTTGWEGAGRVQACEPPKRLLVTTTEAGESEEHAIEATLEADGDGTILVIEERGMPIEHLAAYGAGVQIHAEDLAAHLDGRVRQETKARWDELIPSYRQLAAAVG